MTNVERFQTELTAVYTRLFANDAEYAYSASRITPTKLAAKMTAGLADGSANHDGRGIRHVCKIVGIKPTRTAIREFLKT